MTDYFKEMTLLVIDRLEGGYFHPQMFKDNRIDKKYEYVYRLSGETMFGLDRLNGGKLNKSNAGLKFWAIIDKANAKSDWKWNYRGGIYENRLKSLLVEIMEPYFLKLKSQYLSQKAQKIVEKDKRLMFHFIYACWNGPAWFKMFAKKINDAVKSTSDKEELVEIAVASRRLSKVKLISLGGQRIELIFKTVLKPQKEWVKFLKIIGAATVAATGMYFGYKKLERIKKFNNDKTLRIYGQYGI